jgi:lipopolysaccharide export system permease protein
MISIIQRYLVVEILKSSVATTLILYVILMSNSLGRALSDISVGKLPAEALYPVLLAQSVDVFTMLLPLGFFLGIVFAFGRLYKDHELVVMHACGFGYSHLYRVVFILLIPVLLISVFCSLWFNAEMQAHARRIINEKKNVHEFQQMKPGQFNPSEKNDQVFFMQSMSEDKLEVYDIVIAQQGKDSDVMETAKKGRHKIDETTGDLFLEMGPGIRYQGQSGAADYQVIEFQNHGILLKKKVAIAKALKPYERSFSVILASTLLDDKIELWWRISNSISVLVLSLLAVPLSYIAPRQGRYGKIGVSLLVFIVYLNLLGLTKTSMETGNIPLWLNYWWVHALFLVQTLLLLKMRTGKFFQFWRGKTA